MEIIFDLAKRAVTLADRGLDFCDVPDILTGPTQTLPDTRFAYPEPRFQTYGRLGERLVMFVWAEVDANTIRIISMRKCNDREVRKFGKRLE